MHRVLIFPDAVRGDTLTVTDPEHLHYLRRVLRISVGDAIESFDGTGRVFVGTVERVARDAISIAIQARREEAGPRARILLAQALIRMPRFEWVLEKATELGVAEIVPLATTRTVARPPGGRDGARFIRWRRIVEAAASQCGRATVPTVRPPASFTALLPTLDGRLALLPTLAEEGATLSTCLSGRTLQGDVVLLIGPEGDFSPEEVEQAKAHGAKPVTLGRLTLRSETAAVAALTILQHAVGEL